MQPDEELCKPKCKNPIEMKASKAMKLKSGKGRGSYSCRAAARCTLHCNVRRLAAFTTCHFLNIPYAYWGVHKLVVSVSVCVSACPIRPQSIEHRIGEWGAQSKAGHMEISCIRLILFQMLFACFSSCFLFFSISSIIIPMPRIIISIFCSFFQICKWEYVSFLKHDIYTI